MSALSDGASVPLADSGSLYRKVYWRLLPLLFLCYLVSYLDRVNVGFAKLQMNEALQFNEAVYGLGAGIFFIGYFLFEIPSNMILRRVGAGVWISRIMISWGIVSACTVFVTTPWQFYMVRFALGVAEAGFVPGILYLLTLWFPDQYRGRAVAVFGMGAPISFVVGGPLSGWILQSFQNSPPLQAWQWMFLLEAIPAVILGVVVLFVLKSDFHQVSWLTADEKGQIERELQTSNLRKADHSSVREFLSNPLLWILVLIYFCLILGLYAIAFWLPTLIKRAGVIDSFDIGLLVAIPNLIAATAVYFVSRQADLTGKRRAYFASMLTIGAVGLAAGMFFGAGPIVTTVCMTVAASGIFAAMCNFWALPSSILVGASVAAALAFINSLGNLGGFVSPYLVGWLTVRTGNVDYGIYVISACMLLGAGVTMLLPARIDDEN